MFKWFKFKKRKVNSKKEKQLILMLDNIIREKAILSGRRLKFI